jgi:hypothetical protein
MQTQEVLSTLLMPFEPADLLLSALAALIVYKQASFDTVWDLSNRVCDRYLPQNHTTAQLSD